MGRDLTCAELDELSAELALGTVAGAERASALAHLAGCAGCRNQVEQLARVADRLLLLAPGAEPPPGFESRVLDRVGVAAAAVGPPMTPSRRSARTRVLVGVAAMVAVAGLLGAGAAMVLDDRPTPARADVLTALARDDAGRWTCRAVMYGVDPTWLVLTLDRTDDLSATFAVEAVQNGSDETVLVGDLTIRDGHGTMATEVGLLPERVDAIRVLDATGRLRYTVDFPPT